VYEGRGQAGTDNRGLLESEAKETVLNILPWSPVTRFPDAKNPTMPLRSREDLPLGHAQKKSAKDNESQTDKSCCIRMLQIEKGQTKQAEKEPESVLE
jgi:hypothetical protein